MISADALSNVLAYSAQLAVIVAAAALLSLIVRIDAAGVRYAYWRAVGALCLALPWLQTAHHPATGAVSASSSVVTAIVTAVAPAAVHPGPHMDWAAFAVVVVAIGAIARLTWVAAGLIKLRRLRAAAPRDPGHRRTQKNTDPNPLWNLDQGASTFVCGSDLQETLGTRADVRYVPALAQPVTFGVRRPVILLPAHLRERSPEIQRAVLGHELLHVQRRDWAWLVAEEIVRAALWFHPAAWWLISRIQLAREEAVDELAVMLTGHRKVYVEALLAFADSTSLVPTAAFARRRHLFRRITLVSKEAAMSSRRIVTSCAALALVLATGSWYATYAFPLRQSRTLVSISTGPLERQAHAITPENPVPRRVSSEPMFYPTEAAAVDARGDITLSITLDEVGRVAEARLTHFKFVAPGFELSGEWSSNGNLRDRFEAMVMSKGGRTEPMLGAFDAVTRAATDAVQQWRYDPPFKAPISFPVTLKFGKEPERPQLGSATRSTPGATVSNATNFQEPLRVGGDIKPPTKTKDVRPFYPDAAREAGVEGVVIIEARIEGDGRVGTARILRSIPLLDEAALDAVRQWEFTPTLMNGEPVPVIMTVTIAFSLQ